MIKFKNLSSIDITGAYLQYEELMRDIYVRLPEEFESDKSYPYKLKKTLYSLSDAGRLFWLKITKIFKVNWINSTGILSCYLDYCSKRQFFRIRVVGWKFGVTSTCSNYVVFIGVTFFVFPKFTCIVY